MQDKKELKKKVLVTGGGSGGHISAAQALISAIQKEYIISENNFLYVGGDLSMVGEKTGNSLEMKIFENESFNRKYIRAGKLQRSLDIGSLKLLFRTFLGFVDSYTIIKSFKPDIIVSTGGFVSVPVAIVGKLLNAKIFLHEQTAATGLANKIIGKIADKVFVTYPSSEKYFSEKKTIHTGNLIRKDIFSTNGSGNVVEAVKGMVTKQEQYPIIYISGGSLGSHIINQTVKECLQMLTDNYQVILQTGDNKVFNDYENLQMEKKKLEKRNQENIFVVKYIKNNEIGFLFKNIDLFIGRSGANTVYEMGVLEIPSIFIPIPWATHNEQKKNAQVLEKLGLATIIEEGELIGDTFVNKINTFLHKEKKVDEKELKNIFTTDASEKILKILDLANRS
jgi:UDP-N-acetylglucosamine--N-acetylmuramyl-(pentapeptide) pyrophosphoryl-undecaprenol N-acetylglucosamine transferase